MPRKPPKRKKVPNKSAKRAQDKRNAEWESILATAADVLQQVSTFLRESDLIRSRMTDNENIKLLGEDDIKRIIAASQSYTAVRSQGISQLEILTKQLDTIKDIPAKERNVVNDFAELTAASSELFDALQEVILPDVTVIENLLNQADEIYNNLEAKRPKVIEE